jgi:beta-lactam-binding protein with PASTA domain/tRNA A-37 threonylcarbamoyl transferase component Bud32
LIGKKLGGRYEILEQIGGGGMALVYKGLDMLLHRYVAVKVLRHQYVHDEEFIRRFRREAQSAASLSHPNVVSIYDVGQEGETHYIVMEYIEGTTLNDIIKEKAPLQVEEAVHYASQIADALDHAHHNEIIHRDIKPHNILIGKNGRVKVTDFGIARAATSSTITQTGSVIGSVHYFSPEHAKGTNTGEKSDLYSLGIVMYQMLTGKLPFIGESPISVALKHLQEDVEEPRKVNQLIPQSVENIILKAMRKKTDERYQSASQMHKDLETCLLPERRNEAKVIFWESEGMDEERTLVMPAIRANQFGNPFEAEPAVARGVEPEMTKKNGWIKPLVWIVILLLLLGVMWYLVGYVKGKLAIANTDIMVPNVESMLLPKAEEKLKAANLDNITIERQASDAAKDIVIRQDPKDMKVKFGAKIALIVSSGPTKPKMGSFVGQPLKEAKLQLAVQGVKNDAQFAVTPTFSNEAVDTVLEQFPTPGEEFDAATVVIKLSVSKGPETFKMPDLVGKTEADAKKQISDLGLKLPADGITRDKSYKQPKGKVIMQYPFDFNQDVAPGSQIKLVISDGLPADAGPIDVKVPVKPAVDGKSSVYSIVVSDAQYDNFDYKTDTITKETTINVKIVVSPDSKAVLLVKIDGKLVNSITRTYQDYLDQKNGVSPSPGSSSTASPSPSPSVSPSASPKNGATGASLRPNGSANSAGPSPKGGLN